MRSCGLAVLKHTIIWRPAASCGCTAGSKMLEPFRPDKPFRRSDFCDKIKPTSEGVWRSF